MTNPANPAGVGGIYGFPTSPMYNNATIVIKNGVPTVTVDIRNPIFQLLEIGKADNADVKKVTYDTQESSNYGKRITQLEIELKDYSGFYEFKDSVEFGTPLDDGNPDTDDRWHASVFLAIDFEELLPGSNISNKTWTNDEMHIGLEARGKNLDGVELVVNEVEDTDSMYTIYYNAVNDRINRNLRNPNQKPDFKLYKINLKKGNDEFIPEGRFSANLLAGMNHYYYEATGGSGVQAWQIKNGELVRLSSQVGDGQEGTEWSAPMQYSNFELGYVMICTYKNYIKCEKTFNDNLSGLSLTWYSDEGTKDEVIYPLNLERLNASRIVAKNYTNNKELSNSIVNMLKAEDEDSDVYVEQAYGVWLEALNNGVREKALNKTSHTKVDITLPVEYATDIDSYAVYVVKFSYGDCELVKKMEISAKDASNTIFTLINWGDNQNKTGITDTLMYAGATNSDEEEYEVLAVVRNIKKIEKPSASTGLVYTGAELTGVEGGEGYTLEGNTAKLPNNYTATATLKEGYAWSDGSTDAIQIPWTIKALQTNKPVAVSGLTYNGSNQNGVKAGTGYNLAGTYAAKDAGSYNAKVLLAEGYEWSDGTTDPLTLTWSIAKKKVAKPSAVANLVYNGAAQTGVKAGEGYTVSGNVQTKVGTYAAVATLDKNYAWSDGSTGAANVSWSIDKAAQKVNVKVASKSYKVTTVKKKAQSFTIGASASGKITYKVTGTPSKSAAKYLTVDKNGKVTVKKGAPAGTYTITVSAAATDTYKAADAKVTVKVTKVSQKVTAKVSSKTIKSTKIAKKNTSFSIGAKGKGKVTYKVTATPANAAKYISVSKNGKVTVKKKAPKGTYKITVTAAGNATYAGGSKTITVKVK